MTFFERVSGLCKQQGISVTKLVSDLGHSKSITAAWKSSDCAPRPGTVKGVADYFGVSVDDLMRGVDEPIDYEKINTAEFNQPVWQELLKANGYNERKAIKAYLEFEKAQARDAMSERPTVFQNNGENYGIIGNAHAPVKIINGTERTLTDQEAEILRIFSELTLIEQSRVIVYAAELKDKGGKRSEKGGK